MGKRFVQHFGFGTADRTTAYAPFCEPLSVGVRQKKTWYHHRERIMVGLAGDKTCVSWKWCSGTK